MPTAASSVAITMNARKVPESSTFSLVRASTSSHTTASAGAPLACSTARSACSEIWVSISSSVIAPSCGIPSSLRSEITTLASSRATSARITSPGGRRAAPGEEDDVADRVGALEQLERARRSCRRRVTIRRWITGRRLPGLRPADDQPPRKASRASTAVSGKSEKTPSTPIWK